MFGKLSFFEQNEDKGKRIIVPIKKKIKKEKKHDSVTSRMDMNLSGSKFRLINEFLYTNESKTSFNHFTANAADFKTYHEGFQHQISKWPISPAAFIINLLEKQDKFHNKIVCDLGCGEALIADHFSKKKDKRFKRFYNFDLVSINQHVQVADISNLPLKNGDVDIAIFCLALMGKNYFEFLKEATRIMKINGYLIIAEVNSRIADENLFSEMIEKLGYKTEEKFFPNNYFTILIYKKIVENVDIKQVKLKNFLKKIEEKLNEGRIENILLASQKLLKPCIYKRR